MTALRCGPARNAKTCTRGGPQVSRRGERIVRRTDRPRSQVTVAVRSRAGGANLGDAAAARHLRGESSCHRRLHPAADRHNIRPVERAFVKPCAGALARTGGEKEPSERIYGCGAFAPHRVRAAGSGPHRRRGKLVKMCSGLPDVSFAAQGTCSAARDGATSTSS